MQHVLKNAHPFSQLPLKSTGIASLTFASVLAVPSSAFLQLSPRPSSDSGFLKSDSLCITSSFLGTIFNLSRIACRDISIASTSFGVSSTPLPWPEGSLLSSSQQLEECQMRVPKWGVRCKKKDSHLLYAQKRLWNPSCCLQFQMHLWRVWLSVSLKRLFCCKGNPHW